MIATSTTSLKSPALWNMNSATLLLLKQSTTQDTILWPSRNQGTTISSGQKLDILVVHDPSRPIPPPPSNDDLPFGKMYKVGDSKGWSVTQETDFYYNWGQDKEFHVGDYLLFEYGNEVNDVLEISGHLEFKSCDPTSPVAVHATGHDLVRLTKPGVHYFISSKTGYCEAAGLKLRVEVAPISKVPKLSIIERLTRWLRAFRPHHQ